LKRCRMAKLDDRFIESLDGLDDQAFLGKAYISILGRPVDPSGFRDYLSQLRGGVRRSEICAELARSEEGRKHAARQWGAQASQVASRRNANAKSVTELLTFDGIEFIEQAYWALLGRQADPVGIKDYMSRLSAGTPKLQIVADIFSDPEGQAYGARIEGIQEVTREVQLRQSAPAGSLNDLIAVPDEFFVSSVYRAILGRQPDPVGRELYTNLLRVGMSRLYIIKEIAISAEGASKAPSIKGLKEAIRRYNKANSRTWTGWYLRQVKGVESDFPMERNVRAMAYALRARTRDGS
jgi:hypothetical protein